MSKTSNNSKRWRDQNCLILFRLLFGWRERTLIEENSRRRKRKSLVYTASRLSISTFHTRDLIFVVGLEDEWWKIKNFPRVHKMFLQIICIKRSPEECKMIQSTWQNYGITTHISRAYFNTQAHIFCEAVREKESRWKSASKREETTRKREMALLTHFIVVCESHIPHKPLLNGRMSYDWQKYVHRTLYTAHKSQLSDWEWERGRMTTKKTDWKTKKRSQDAEGKSLKNIKCRKRKSLCSDENKTFDSATGRCLPNQENAVIMYSTVLCTFD